VVSPSEWQSCLETITEARCDFLVVSGSLPQGVPGDFYAQVANVANKRGIRVILDSSGPGLAQGLAGRGIFLVKPSIGELRGLTSQDLASEDAIAEAAAAIVRRGEAQHVAVTMGRDGGLLANASGELRLPAIPVKAESAVGAGDSFLAAMVHALASGQEAADAFRFGLAAGAAAAVSRGTDLAAPEDIRRLAASSGDLRMSEAGLT
jgi:6-phosphofructokinase 2